LTAASILKKTWKKKNAGARHLEGFEIEILQESPQRRLRRKIRSRDSVTAHSKRDGKEPAFEMCPGLLETRFYAVTVFPRSLLDRDC